MYIIERMNGPYTLTPVEFKTRAEVDVIFTKLKLKGVPSQLYKTTKTGKELVDTSGGPHQGLSLNEVL